MNTTYIKQKLAELYQVDKVTASFMCGVSVDYEEPGYAEMNAYLANHPDINKSTRVFWEGVYDAVFNPTYFFRITDQLSRTLQKLNCSIVSDIVDPAGEFRKITVVTPNKTKILCSCNLIDNKAFVTLQKIGSFPHTLSRFSPYDVNRTLQSIYSEV